MIARRIMDATHRLAAPKGWDTANHGKCIDLSVRAEPDGVFASAWEPTPDELELLNAGGSVVLRVVGGQPPVALSVETPPSGNGDTAND